MRAQIVRARPTCVQIVVQLLTVLRELNPTCTRTRPWMKRSPSHSPRVLPSLPVKNEPHFDIFTGIDTPRQEVSLDGTGPGDGLRDARLVCYDR